jgi:hypothetical protein
MVDDQLRSNLGDNKCPHLKKLAEAIESRPNLKNYLNK